jgi:hypothetical protein
MDARPLAEGETGMKKWWMALWAVLALSIGVAWAEGTNGKTNAECKADGGSCCCCAKTCPK